MLFVMFSAIPKQRVVQLSNSQKKENIIRKFGEEKKTDVL